VNEHLKTLYLKRGFMLSKRVLFGALTGLVFGLLYGVSVQAQTTDLCADVERYAPDFSTFCEQYPSQIADMMLPLADDGLLSPEMAARLFYLRGQNYETAGNIDEATIAYTRAIEADSHYAPPYIARAQIAINAGMGSDAVLRDLSIALLLDPINEQAYLLRSRLLANRGDAQKALEDLNNALLINPDNRDGYIQRATLYEVLNETASALDDINTALQMAPDDSTLLRRGAQLTENLRDFPTAVTYWRRIIEGGDTSADAAYSLARMLEQIGEYEEAIEWHDRALAIGTSYNAFVYQCRGNAYLKLGNLEQAFRDYDMSIQLNPGFAGGLISRAEVYMLTQDYDRALQDAVQAVAIQGNSYNYAQLAQIQAYQGDDQSAKQSVTRAYEAAIAENAIIPEYAFVVMQDFAVAEILGEDEAALTIAHNYVDELATNQQVYTSSTILPNQTLNIGEQHRYLLNLPAGVIQVNLNAVNNRADLALAVRRLDGTPLAFNDDCDLTTSNACLTLTLEQPEELLFIVVDFAQKHDSYQLEWLTVTDATVPEATEAAP
jgi:tetratricopeptide (TPR) repeat protein